MKRLPPTGTAGLLEALSPYIPDEFVNALLATSAGPGRRAHFSPAQLLRVSLLALLTPAHSFNLVVELLAENRHWRSFAWLPNRRALPDVRMLNQFRQRLDLIKLRRINQHLLTPLLEGTRSLGQTVSVIDSTDLPAATNAYKKSPMAATALSELRLVDAAARMDRAVGSSATRSTRCECGWDSIRRVSFWFR